MWSGEIRHRDYYIEVIGNQRFIGDDEAEGEFFKDCYLSDASRLDGLGSISLIVEFQMLHLLLTNLED